MTTTKPVPATAAAGMDLDKILARVAELDPDLDDMLEIVAGLLSVFGPLAARLLDKVQPLTTRFSNALARAYDELHGGWLTDGVYEPAAERLRVNELWELADQVLAADPNEYRYPKGKAPKPYVPECAREAS